MGPRWMHTSAFTCIASFLICVLPGSSDFAACGSLTEGVTEHGALDVVEVIKVKLWETTLLQCPFFRIV
jgi:hypothetical protein